MNVLAQIEGQHAEAQRQRVFDVFRLLEMVAVRAETAGEVLTENGKARRVEHVLICPPGKVEFAYGLLGENGHDVVLLHQPYVPVGGNAQTVAQADRTIVAQHGFRGREGEELS